MNYGGVDTSILVVYNTAVPCRAAAVGAASPWFEFLPGTAARTHLLDSEYYWTTLFFFCYYCCVYFDLTYHDGRWSVWTSRRPETGDSAEDAKLRN